MTDKTKHIVKFPGFFECQHHDGLKPLLEDKPPTLCRNCFNRISGNLVLYLAQTMNETLRLENILVQHTDMIEDILERLEAQDKYITQLIGGKTKSREVN